MWSDEAWNQRKVRVGISTTQCVAPVTLNHFEGVPIVHLGLTLRACGLMEYEISAKFELEFPPPSANVPNSSAWDRNYKIRPHILCLPRLTWTSFMWQTGPGLPPPFLHTARDQNWTVGRPGNEATKWAQWGCCKMEEHWYCSTVETWLLVEHWDTIQSWLLCMPYIDLSMACNELNQLNWGWF